MGAMLQAIPWEQEALAAQRDINWRDGPFWNSAGLLRKSATLYSSHTHGIIYHWGGNSIRLNQESEKIFKSC